MKSMSLFAAIACSILGLALTGAIAADAPKKPGDKKPKPVNAVCPVTDDKADPAITTAYKGKTIAFCCEDCVKDFNKEPTKFIKKVEAEEAKNKKAGKKDLQSAADKTKPVNTLCPIEKENAVDPTVATSTYQGKTIGFCCDDCVKKFGLNPAAYVADLK